jgi:hypothetical protein
VPISTDPLKTVPSSDAVTDTLEDFPWTLEVALSGGGHRATAYALGVLLYLVHAKLNQRVRNIASVSGASITNAFVAQCDFNNVGIDEFRGIASQLISKVARHGLLSVRTTWFCVAAVFIVAIVGCLPFGFVWWGFVSDTWALHMWGALAIFLIFLSVLLTTRGWVIDRWMGAVYFPPFRSRDWDKTVRLGDIGETSPNIDHVFCATDLNSGRPFFFSSAFRGRLFSRFYGRAEAPFVPLQTAVRASSAFPPAIPAIHYALYPYRFISKDRQGLQKRSVPVTSGFKERFGLPSIRLTDGGAFNNFGTDWNLARRIVVELDRRWCEKRLEAFHPYESDEDVSELYESVEYKKLEDDLRKIGAFDYYGEVQLVADASQPERWKLLCGLQLPFWGLVKYALRTMSIMYGSTLEARSGEASYVAIARMERSRDRWWPDPAKPREDYYKERAARFNEFAKDFGDEGPLQIYVAYQMRSDISYNWWKGRPRFTPASEARLTDHPKYRAAGEEALKDLLPEELEIVPTTFRSLKGQALRLVVAGYLNTREAIYGPFDYLPEPIPEREWFIKLLPSYDDRPSESLWRRLRNSIMQRWPRLMRLMSPEDCRTEWWLRKTVVERTLYAAMSYMLLVLILLGMLIG